LEEEHLIKLIEDTRKLLHNTTKIIINDGTVRKEFTEEESKRIRENIDKLKSQISKILEESKKAGRNKEILSALSELSTSIDMSVDFVPRGKEIEGTPLEMFLELDDCRRLIEDFVQQSYVKKEDMGLDIKKVLESGTKGEKIELLRKISGMKLAEEDISALLKAYDQEKDPEISKMLKGVISMGLKKDTFDYATVVINSISPKARLEAVKYIDALELNNIIEIRNVLFDAYLKEEDTIVRNMLIDVITRRFGPELFLEYTNRIKKEEDFEKLAALLPATHDMIVKIWDKVGNNRLSENNTKFIESLLNRARAAHDKGAEDLNLQDIYVLSKKDEEYKSKIVTNLAPYGAKVYKLLEKGSTLGDISKGTKIGITNATRIIQDLMLADIVVIRKNEVTQANQEEIISSREGEEVFNVLFNPVKDAAEIADSQEEIAEMRRRKTDEIPVMEILKDAGKNIQEPEIAGADEKESKPAAENISQEISSINNKTEESIKKEMSGDLSMANAPEDSVVQEIAQGILREVFSEEKSNEINESAKERSLVTNETNRSVREILLKIAETREIKEETIVAEEVAGEENRADQKSGEKLEIEVKTESPESEKKEIPEKEIEEKPETERKTEIPKLENREEIEKKETEKEEGLEVEKKEVQMPEPENKLSIVVLPTGQEKEIETGKEETQITEKKEESNGPEPEKKVIIDESAYNTSVKRGNESKSKPVGRGPPPAPKEEDEKGEEKKAKNEVPQTEEDIKIAEELSWVLSRCFQYGKVTDERVLRLTNEILKEIAKDKRVEVTDIIDIAVRAQIPFVSQRNIEKNAYELEQALLNAYYKFPRKSKKENVGKRVLKWLAVAALIAGISAGVWRYGGEIPKKEIYTYTNNVYKESNKIAKDALKLIERKANDIENRAKNARKKAEDIAGKVKKMKQ